MSMVPCMGRRIPAMANRSCDMAVHDLGMAGPMPCHALPMSGGGAPPPRGIALCARTQVPLDRN